MVDNRFGVKLPKLGIRVIVDGRRNGVREKLEVPTRRLAENAKKLIENNLSYPNGERVECVVSKLSIGGAKEAALVAEQFCEENVAAIISVSRAFAYAAEIMETDDRIPQAIWGFNGSERPGAVYLAAATAVSEQKGIPIFKIYGEHVQDADDLSIPADVAEKILSFARGALAVALIRGKSYLSIGGVCMGIGSSIVDSDFFRSYLGMRNEYIDMSEITRRLTMQIYDKDEYQRALVWTKEHCLEMEDPNAEESRKSREEKDRDWETVVKMTLIMRDLMVGNDRLAEMGYEEEANGHFAIAAGFQGQRQWTDFMPNGDFSEAILNSSFDWNGTRQPYILATENDSMNGVTMLLGNMLTGRAQLFADVRSFWSKEAVQKTAGYELQGLARDGFMYLSNSGASCLDGTMSMRDEAGKYTIKQHVDVKEEDIANCLQNTKWGAGKLVSFRGGGFSSSFCSQGGVPITVLRMSMVKGLGPMLQVVEGHTIELPKEVEDIIVARTDPTWPKTFFVPRLTDKFCFQSVYSIMNMWSSNHCTISYGHVGKDFLTLASMLRIPIGAHNIEEAQVFRPSAWYLFGADDQYGHDFRACQNFGSLYGKY